MGSSDGGVAGAAGDGWGGGRRVTRGGNRPSVTGVEPSRRIMKAAMIKLLAPVGLLLLALGAAGCARSTEPGPGSASAVLAAPSTVAGTSSSLDPPADWPAFTSTEGRYRLRYPPGWGVKESTGSGGPVLSLLPPRGTGITVLVTFNAPPAAGGTNLPTPGANRSELAGWRAADAWTRSRWW
jgi:hypothetical protein